MISYLFFLKNGEKHQQVSLKHWPVWHFLSGLYCYLVLIFFSIENLLKTSFLLLFANANILLADVI